MRTVDAYIGIGTNLGDRWANLRFGLDGLERAGFEVVRVSSVWEAEPVGTDVPLWFLNMAAHVRVQKLPLGVLDSLLRIESAAGRERTEPNGPRTLDLDLLMLEQLSWRDERLELPHPRMWDRRFVLEPLSEIAPELRNPRTGRTVAEETRRARNGSVVLNVGRL